MNSIDPQEWARNFAADLIVGGERVPFDRVLQAHADAIAALRAQGLTWASLVRLLGRAGVRRADGKIYSADHLRVAFQRLARAGLRQREQTSVRRPAAREPSATSFRPSATTERPAPIPDTSRASVAALPAAGVSTIAAPVEAWSESTDDKDISGDELDSVLSRLNRVK